MTDFDVSQTLSLLSAEQRSELELLLHPISDYNPSGPPIRFDPVFTAIRLAREEDGSRLRMGAWEHPLKRTEWARIEAHCKATLRERAKDLQIAAWLAESWCRQHGMEGFLRGQLLVHGLLALYWDTVHPQVDEDGDADLRAALLELMNADLSLTIETMVPLLGRTVRQSDRLSLMDWERITADEAAPSQVSEGSAAQESGESQQTRADFIDYARANLRTDVDRSTRLVRACLAVVMAIESLTKARLGADAPAMSTLRETLRAMEHALLELTAEREPEIVQSQDSKRTPAEAFDDTAQPKKEGAGDVIQSNQAPPAEPAQPDPAGELSRRIDAICKAAGIQAPSGAERLMAMQIGLLHDQNRILQDVRAGTDSRKSGKDGGDDADGDFAALIDALTRGTDSAQ
ncbi:type VI secretion system protein TssA [Massilia sp. CFBP9012]|uniref:type VI secretion system protein TssA n=1 Tax=Massilia sp. CFBP9012 TaxID=3096531 RepID=UPI002A6B3C82|nr:type VI secretion system protein TssA [Massilia sp. CFBP9012]MDY0976189.1 type VI secretion system protein TssA [Massilia sp. CFBP9012]